MMLQLRSDELQQYCGRGECCISPFLCAFSPLSPFHDSYTCLVYCLIFLPRLLGDALRYGHAVETGFSDGRKETRRQGKLMAPA